MNIGIIGRGFVGSAVANGFLHPQDLKEISEFMIKINPDL